MEYPGSVPGHGGSARNSLCVRGNTGFPGNYFGALRHSGWQPQGMALSGNKGLQWLRRMGLGYGFLLATAVQS